MALRTIFGVVAVVGVASATSDAGSARSLAETVARLQEAAFNDGATADAIVKSLRAQAPSHASFAQIPEYPLAEQSAFQAQSPDVIHINFDVPNAARTSFLQTKSSDPVGDLMSAYSQIGSVMHNYESGQVASEAEVSSMVEKANSATGEANSFVGEEATTSGTKPVLEVRLAAPKVAPWDSALASLVQQRESLENKYMAMFRDLLDKQSPAKRSSFLQRAQRDSVQIKVGDSQKVDPELMSLVETHEKQRNASEEMMLKSAFDSLQSLVKTSQHASRVFAERRSEPEFDIKVGSGSKPFGSFIDSVRKMEDSRHAAEERIRGQVLSMVSRLSESNGKAQ